MKTRNSTFTIHTKPDKEGRQQFTVEWEVDPKDDFMGRSRRGQVFFANVQQHVKSSKEAGYKVTIINQFN